MKIEKPKVLSKVVLEERAKNCTGTTYGNILWWLQWLCETQRDDTYQKMLDAFEPLIQQAKVEVAREIFEVYDAYIESLGSDLNKLTQLVIKHEREHKAKILSLKGRFPKEAA